MPLIAVNNGDAGRGILLDNDFSNRSGLGESCRQRRGWAKDPRGRWRAGGLIYHRSLKGGVWMILG